MSQPTIKEIISWDIVNWSKAIEYWEKRLPQELTDKKGLELGGREGGLSLWMANKGIQALCSDVSNPKETASNIHNRYNYAINYEAINALKINYENEFDLIVFKSILGGISAHGKDHLKEQAINQMRKALKPGGKLLFAENLAGSYFHKYLRNKFVKWGSNWNYLAINEVKELFKEFSAVEFETFGFLATFGRSEGQRSLLGKLDRYISPLVGQKNNYIIYGVATK